METITVNIDENLAQEFRKKAADRYGIKKGHLSKAVSEAFLEWLNKKDDLINEAIAIMDKGINAPTLRYTKRSEMHE